MSRNVLHDFDNGHGLTNKQMDQLGIWVPDEEDGFWVYGQYFENGAYLTGHVLRSAAGADLGGDGTVTQAIPAGANYLIDSGHFDDVDYRGAIGYIYEGAGKGQTFYISQMIPNDDDRVYIKLIAARGVRPRSDGWAVALGTTSKYRLILPGRFYKSDGAATDIHAGLCQTALTVTDDYKPYGWAKCAGGAVARNDQSSTNNITMSGFVAALNGGLVEGIPSAVTRTIMGRVIGIADAVPDDTTDDALFPVSLTLPKRRPSFNYDIAAKHSGNTVTI